MNDALIPVDLHAYRLELSRLGKQWAATRALAQTQRDQVRATVLQAIGYGMSEAEASRCAGVPRKTVRDWQGKK